MKKILTVVLFLVAFINISFAGGFQINEHSARAQAMGGAFTAHASDPSAIFFNPAGLSFQSGTNVMLGTTLIFPKSDFTGPTPSTIKTKMSSNVFYPSNLYITHGMNNGFAFGLGVYNHYGLGTEWPSNWAGKSLSVKTDLKTYFINPSVSYKISNSFSIGLGVSYVYGTVAFKNIFDVPVTPSFISVGVPDIIVDLEGAGSGYNFNAGLLMKPTEYLSIGFAYRHSTKIEFKGDAKFTNTAHLAGLFPNGPGKTTITLPSNLFAGVAYDFSNNFTFEAGLQFIGWSSYDALNIDFENNTIAWPDINSSKKWSDTYAVRLGGEYRFGRYAIRGGYVYDKTPQPDESVEPMLPDADRNVLSVGFGYVISKLITLDLAYEIVLFNERTVTAKNNVFPGTYKSTAHLVGFNFSYKF
ncbi:MAG: outer membrane protein transport protein [Bacteroidetes bacterium]|nr:outer membrane protein transport protein [Bacteroidota bacterium]